MEVFQMSSRQLKRLLIGDPLLSSEAQHERLSKVKALAVFASDALSSTAYATEEILIVLTSVSITFSVYSLPIALAIVALIFIVAFSYTQTVRAYPQGGGSYTVASENLGVNYGLVAGSSLLIDYVLTAAVSISAGVAAITSAVPELYAYRVVLAIFFLAIVTIINLRGVRESGTLFAVPTYCFMLSIALLIIAGLYRELTGTLAVQNSVAAAGFPAISAFVVLRAFSSGCSALTGVEAISNGVPAFRKPESENAVKTLRWMAIILAVLFMGITYLAFVTKIVPNEQETVISQIAHSVFGSGPMYFIVQAATAMILLLAANTSFAGFPRLASVMAKDQYFPRQFAFIGDRLVFSNGIIFLAAVTSVVIIVFQGNTHHLIPLYAVGVFLSFTLSQSGMVLHWLKAPGNNKRHILVNATGAVITAIVLVIVLGTKFLHGAWVVAVLIPVLVGVLTVIHRHYSGLSVELRLDPTSVPEDTEPFPMLVVVPVAGVNKSVANSIRYAGTISDNVLAVHVATNEEVAKKTKSSWDKMGWGVPLEILPSPYRSLFYPLFLFLHDKRRELTKAAPEALLVVVIPEFVYSRWWEYLLHSETEVLLKFLLRFEPNIVICSVPYHISQRGKS